MYACQIYTTNLLYHLCVLVVHMHCVFICVFIVFVVCLYCIYNLSGDWFSFLIITCESPTVWRKAINAFRGCTNRALSLSFTLWFDAAASPLKSAAGCFFVLPLLNCIVPWEAESGSARRSEHSTSETHLLCLEDIDALCLHSSAVRYIEGWERYQLNPLFMIYSNTCWLCERMGRYFYWKIRLVNNTWCWLDFRAKMDCFHVLDSTVHYG